MTMKWTPLSVGTKSYSRTGTAIEGNVPCVRFPGFDAVVVSLGAPRSDTAKFATLIAAAPALASALAQIVRDRDETEAEFWGKPTQIRNSSIDAARAALKAAGWEG